MKTKNFFEVVEQDKPAPVAKKTKSLRPMRSMVASRSMKSKTIAAGVVVVSERATSAAPKN